MPNPREALTNAEPVNKNGLFGVPPLERGRSAANHSPCATLHAYHPERVPVNV